MRYINLLGLIACLFFIQPVSAQGGLQLRKYDSVKDISYLPSPVSDSQKLDIYIPSKTLESQKPFPVHVYVHGGAWAIGDKRISRPKDIRSYTSEGIILVSVNYRLGQEGQYPANMQDIQAASLWINRNISRYGGDPRNMVISGHSAGAHLIAIAEIQTQNRHLGNNKRSIFNAIFPIDTASFDLTQSDDSKLSRLINTQKTIVFGETRAELMQASPIHQLKPNANYAPFNIFVTSERDDAAHQSLRLSARLNAQGTASKTTLIQDGASHSDMQDKIFERDSLIHREIVTTLKH